MVLKARDLLVRQHTQIANAFRSHLSELGIVTSAGMASLEKLTDLVRNPRTSDLVRSNVKALRAGLDLVQLLAEIRSGQQTLVAIADRTIAPSEPIAIADFLAGLRTAWRTGEVRPTAQLKPKLKRERRRPDPLSRSPTSYGLGSRPTRRRPEETCSSASRPPIPTLTRTGWFERCNAA